jgi:hypothetical protein
MSNKEKEQFKKRFGVFRIEEAELERMFKQEEHKRRAFEVNEAAFQAAMAREAMIQMGYGAAGGASQTTSAPTSELAESTFIYWEDATTGTWKFFVHDYGTNTSSPITDTELDYSVYNSITSSYIIEQSGFSWQALDNSTNDRVVFCVRADGTLAESFNYPIGTSSRRNFEYLTHVWYWVDGGQTYFKIFNGNVVSSTSLPFAASSFSYNTTSGEASKNRTVSFKVNGDTTYVLSAAGDLVNVTSQVGNNYFYATSLQSDFLCFINRDGSSIPQSVVIVNEDGTIRNTFDLTALSIDSINEQGVYGENQWSGMFQEASADWVWVKYDYISNSFFTETHPNTNYNQISRFQDFRETVDSFNNYQLNSVVALYSGDNTNVWGTNYDYLTFLWSIGSGGTFQSSVTTGTSREIVFGSEPIYTESPAFLIGPPSGGTGYIQVGILTDTGTIQYAQTGQLSEECQSVNLYSIGNTSMFFFVSGGANTRIEFWKDTLIETYTLEGSSSWNFNINGSTLVAINNDDYNDSFWYTENSPTINPMPALVNVNVDDFQGWGTLTGVQESKQIFWENNSNSQEFSKLYILTNEGGLSSEIIGNETSSAPGVDLERGVFNWVYTDPTSGNIIISQYSLSTGLILASVDTGETTISLDESYGIRSFVTRNDTPTSGSITLWMQGPIGTTTSVIETTNWGYMHNDSEWED